MDEPNTRSFDVLVRKMRFVDHALTATAHGEEKKSYPSIGALRLERILVTTEMENILRSLHA